MTYVMIMALIKNKNLSFDWIKRETLWTWGSDWSLLFSIWSKVKLFRSQNVFLKVFLASHIWVRGIILYVRNFVNDCNLSKLRIHPDVFAIQEIVAPEFATCREKQPIQWELIFKDTWTCQIFFYGYLCYYILCFRASKLFMFCKMLGNFLIDPVFTGSRDVVTKF